MTNPSLPKAIAPAELTDALRSSGAIERQRVIDVAVETSFATVLSHIFRLRLTYDQPPAKAPSTLILKAGLADRPGGPWFGGRQEVTFYRERPAGTARRLAAVGPLADREPGLAARERHPAGDLVEQLRAHSPGRGRPRMS
ncbi:hypothetical protein [Variovorax sp. HW608]|uniref:hypothetical protein n=1 Tax=Variovorax sp. HW608 TaxID=1034889 RepID=UPI0012FE02CB|nr:hypothetical protein [Variovorax sp. HW608]